jgi:hypothetical protein
MFKAANPYDEIVGTSRATGLSGPNVGGRELTNILAN